MIKLDKGGKINLSKEQPGLTIVRADLKWSSPENAIDKRGNPVDFDVDVSAFVLVPDASGEPKLIADEYFVFYGNDESPDHAVKHSGDDRTGADATGVDGANETVTADLSQTKGSEISVILSIHEAVARGQHFGQVKGSKITLINDKTGAVIGKYELDEDFDGQTIVQVGSFFKTGSEWEFKAIGMGYKLGLVDIVRKYGGNA